MQHKNNWNAKILTETNILYSDEQLVHLMLMTLRCRYTLPAAGMVLLRLLLLVLMNEQGFVYSIEDEGVSITNKYETYHQRQDHMGYPFLKRLKKKYVDAENEYSHKSTFPHSNKPLLNEILLGSKKHSDEEIVDKDSFRTNPQQSNSIPMFVRRKRKTVLSNHSKITNKTTNITMTSTLSWENATLPAKKVHLTPLELERIRQVESRWAMASMTFLLIVLCGAVWYSGMCHNRIRYVDPKDETSQHSASIKDILRIKAPFLPRFVSNWKRRSQQHKNVHYRPLENIDEYDSGSEDEVLNTRDLKMT